MKEITGFIADGIKQRAKGKTTKQTNKCKATNKN